MTIGIITEGIAERSSLIIIVDKLRKLGLNITNPLFAPLQPKASAGQIVKSAEDRIHLLNRQKCDKIILIIDHEGNENCVIDWRKELEQEISKRGFKNVNVVIKVRQFENWLLADLEAIDSCKNFSVTKTLKNKVEHNKADHIRNPVAELSKIKNNKESYHKNKDSKAIAKNLDIDRMSLNSRSFRRLLTLVNHPKYQDQSKIPQQ